MESYEDGLAKAYAHDSGLHHEGNTLYIAGTRNLRDVSQWPLIPFQKTKHSDIYKRMDDYLSRNPDINTLIGHSAAGAAVLEKAKHDKKYTTITYGSPTFNTDMFSKQNVIRIINRHANMFDPVALLDTGSNRSFIPRSLNPHSASSAYRRNNNMFNDDFVSYRNKRNKF